MSGPRVRRRVEDEAQAEEAWALEDYEWDPISCVARKKRMLAPGEATVATNAALSALQEIFPEGSIQAAADNPRLASLPVLETVDRIDAEPATVCEVIGCGATLDGLKRYYVRMRVCERHLHAPAIVVNGVVSRFCQQCAKFQFVGEFTGSKKSCAATLERHNARHRAKVLARMQELNDADSDGALGGGSRPKGRSKASTAAARRKAAKPPAAATAAAATAARTATERTGSDTSGAGTPDGFSWPPQMPLPMAGQAFSGPQQQQHLKTDFGDGAYVGSKGLAAAPAPSLLPGTQAHSAGAPVLSAEATAPSKPASPHLVANAWDGASSSLLERPPRPLVTTGGNGMVSTGERAASAPDGSSGSGPVAAAPQQQQHLLHSTRAPSGWPLQRLPYDVVCGLAAVHGQLLTDGPPRAMGGMTGLLAGGDSGSGYGANQGGWQHQQQRYHQFAPNGPSPVSLAPAPRQGAASGGSTPSVSNALGASGSDTSAAKASQATARQAMQAAGAGSMGIAGPGGAFGDGRYPGGGGAVYANIGFLDAATTTKSGGSHQSEAEPCGSSGRVVTNAASPLCSQDEGVSATRVSASGAGVDGGDCSGADASAPLQPGAVAARISCIMQELCPLIEQFKQEVTHGSVAAIEPQESALAAAAAAAAAGPGRRTSPGSDAEACFPAGVAAAAAAPTLLAVGTPDASVAPSRSRDRVGSSSLPPLMDTAMAMMQTASQLAASLQQARSATANGQQQQQPHAWTVTSGGPEARLPPLDSRVLDSSRSQSASDLMHASSTPRPQPQTAMAAAAVQQQPPQLQRGPSHHPTGWRPLASHPGIVVNEAAAHQSQQALAAMTTFMMAAVGVASTVPQPPGPTGPGFAMPAPSHATGIPTTANISANHLGGSGGDGSYAIANRVSALGPPGYGAPEQLPCPGRDAGLPAGPGGGPEDAGAAGGAARDDDSDDEMFQQLLTYLQDEATGEEFSTVQHAQHTQQQQLYQGIAGAAQHAVSSHQQVVHAMPYGHVPASPFYWPSQSQAPPPGGAHPYEPPPAPHPHDPLPPPPHHQYPHQQHHFHPQVLVQAPYGWPGPVAAPGGGAPPAPVVVEEPDDVDPRELTRVSLKVMNVLPHELPPNLRSNLRRWLKEARAEALQATLRPGCLQLVVDVLRPPSAPELSSVLIPANDAEEAAVAVFKVLGQRLRDTYVQVDRQVLQMRVGERPAVLSWEDAAHDGGLDGAKYPTLGGCSAAAVCAGSEAVLQLNGGHLSQTGTKVYARLRGHDLHTTLLPPAAAAAAGREGTLRMTVAMPPGVVGLMAVEVGVGHLLGDWWPLLVLPPGCEGAAAEVQRLQADAATSAEGQQSRAFRRFLFDLANVVEVFSDAAASDASAAAVNAAAAAAAAAAAVRARASSSGGGAAAADTSAPDASGTAGGADAAGARSPPLEGRCPSPSGGTGTSSDASFTAVSAAGWSCAGRTDTLMSTNAGSTLGSFMTTSSALASTSMGMAAGQAHALAAQQAQHLAATAAGGAPAAAAGAAAGAAAAAAVPDIALLPPPPTATMRQALSRSARLLRFAVARGLPHLTALMLAAAKCLARAPDGNRQPPHTPPQPPSQPLSQAATPDSSSSRAELLAAAGVDPQALLPLAVLSGSAETVDRLMAFAARVLGASLRLDLPQGPGGLSALHLAALLPDGGALARHLLSTQPWAAWEWLSLGWNPPSKLMEVGAPGASAFESAAAAAADDEAAEADEEEEAVVAPAPPGPVRLTPGRLSMLLGGKSTVARAVTELVAAQQGDGGGSLARPGSAAPAPAAEALVAVVEAWGRTGVALLEALCAQLAAQRL